MNKYVKLTEQYYERHVELAERELDPHRKAIILNYIEHAALEGTDRWAEILEPERIVDVPIYNIRMGTPNVLRLQGREAVRQFYALLKEGVLTNEFINFAVADWGFASFFKIHLFMSGDTLVRQGTPIDDPLAFYHLEMPLVGMYWEYDEQARLVGENVYDILPPILTKMDPKDAPTADEVQRVLRRYLEPHRATDG